MTDFSKAHPGHLYIVGVGPGSPDLLTLRAVHILETANVIVAPRSSTAKVSLALNVVRPYLHGQEILEHVYPMERDAEQTAQCWARMASLVVERVEQGKSVAHITIGDPLIYSTSAYLLEQIGSQIDQGKIHIVSGIMAMQAASALIGEPLLTQDDRLMLLPADDLEAVEAALSGCETLVIYKIGSRGQALVDLLRRHGRERGARLVCYAEQERQQVFLNLDEIQNGQLSYMSTMIVRIDHRPWRHAQRSL